MAVYKPEGRMPAHAEDAAQWTELDLQRAMIQGTILEGRAILCDKDHNLLVQVGGFTGFMPRKEAAMGIREGTAREIAIISRVNKPVAFRIIDIARDGQDVVPILSRAQVQEECLSYCLSHLSPGDVTEARVTHGHRLRRDVADHHRQYFHFANRPPRGPLCGGTGDSGRCQGDRL